MRVSFKEMDLDNRITEQIGASHDLDKIDRYVSSIKSERLIVSETENDSKIDLVTEQR